MENNYQLVPKTTVASDSVIKGSFSEHSKTFPSAVSYDYIYAAKELLLSFPIEVKTCLVTVSLD